MANIPEAPRAPIPPETEVVSRAADSLFKQPVGHNPAINPAIAEPNPNIATDLTAGIVTPEENVGLDSPENIPANFAFSPAGADESLRQNMTSALAEMMLDIGE